ncbi:MAG: hypothetical protein DSM107014_13685 [Gomphosphaeria aponina SAG 52.96 = DSM 107014]|uniref:Uncharacterized protein n=1 Tax=Gomphosphaeria aponina SAG 52.96 = DSM 107014 TaxID=1521640 RepID=A0A941JQF0_9CHRO|nr:hypothetical protein [Gomphosphaeria aponina SAG 52.96 = DSM 107014]
MWLIETGKKQVKARRFNFCDLENKHEYWLHSLETTEINDEEIGAIYTKKWTNRSFLKMNLNLDKLITKN